MIPKGSKPVAGGGAAKPPESRAHLNRLTAERSQNLAALQAGALSICDLSGIGGQMGRRQPEAALRLHPATGWDRFAVGEHESRPEAALHLLRAAGWDCFAVEVLPTLYLRDSRLPGCGGERKSSSDSIFISPPRAPSRNTDSSGHALDHGVPVAAVDRYTVSLL